MSTNSSPQVARETLALRLGILRCPVCFAKLDLGEGLYCSHCKRSYQDARTGQLSFLASGIDSVKSNIQTFWGDTYKQWYAAQDKNQNPESLNEELVAVEELFKLRGHLATTEMDYQGCRGKEVLEIGSGSGAHSALFRKYGAHVTAVDITPERVFSTGQKLGFLESLPEGSGLVLQADAENLPFWDNSFDIVYSNGVLHHSKNTERCLQEVYRVLKPGGEAIVMLYSKNSALFWLSLLPYALLKGFVFAMPAPYWLGRVTEGRPQYSNQRNPITRVYSKRQLLQLFGQFETVFTRKNSFTFGHLPFPKADSLREKILMLLGWEKHNGGHMLYGRPVVPETRLEMWLGRFFGFCWNIKALKAK